MGDYIYGRPVTKDIVAQARAALRDANLDDLLLFLSIAEATSRNELTPQVAQHRSAKIDPAYGRLLKFAKEWGLLSILISLIALYLQNKDLSDNTDEQILDELKRNNAQNERVLEELRRLKAPHAPPPVVPVAPPSNPNRHTRRAKNANRRRKGPARL